MALPARPDTIFEANFFNTQDGQAWTNLSNFVELQEGVSISQRRQIIFDEVSAGSMSISLDNSNGDFNNNRSDLQFFGLINIDVPVRYRIRWPRNPTDTVNMLAAEESTASDTDAFTAESGTLDLETSAVPAGQTTALIWNTGVLPNTSTRCITGDFNSRSADEYPVYVNPSTQYTFSTQVKCDTAGTGITFRVSARVLWYDKTGQPISESTGTSTLLTTSYQQVKVTATSPSNAYTARVAIANETTVSPATATIAITSYTADVVNKGGRFTHLRIPAEANIGDVALLWQYANAQPTYATLPSGWTSLNSGGTNDLRGKLRVAWKIVTQADIDKVIEFSINQTGKHWMGMLATYSGVDNAAPINTSAISQEATYQTTHTSPNVTTAAANCLLANGIFDTSTTNVNWTPPGTVTARKEAFSIGGNAVAGIIADAAGGVAGVKTGVIYTSSAASKFASMSTIALKPTTGTGPGNVVVWIGAWQLETGATATTWAAGGTWLDLFSGSVDSWSKTFSGDLSLMAVQATDVSKKLATVNIGPAVYQAILSADPVAYYILNESGDASTSQGANSAHTAQNTMKVVQIGAGGTLSWGQGIGPPVDGTPAVQIDKSTINNGQVLRTFLKNPVSNSSAVTIAVWFSSTDTDTSSTITIAKTSPVVSGTGGAEPTYAELRATSGTNFQANSSVKSGNIAIFSTAVDSTNYFDGKTHLAVGTFELTGGQLVATLYIDGVQTAQNSTAATFTEFPSFNVLNVGNAYPTNHIASGTYSHVALFDYIVDADTIADIYDAGTTAYAGDTVDQRIGRICTWAGIGNQDLDVSDIICDRHMPDPQSALSAIQQAAKTDGGTSFINGSGKVTFKSRLDKEGTLTTWLSVNAQYVQPAMTEVTDDQLLVNQAVVTQLSTGSRATSSDLDSQDIHGVREDDRDSIAQSTDEAQNEADYLTAFYAVPTQRCDNITIEAVFLQAWSTIITQDMWNIIHLSNLPLIEQSTTLDLYVEGWSHAITDETWEITYDTSAAIPFAVLNDSARGVVGAVVVSW